MMQGKETSRLDAWKGEKKTLREWRKQFRLSQNQLIELAGLDAAARGKLGEIERGLRPVHSPLGEKLAEAMGLYVSQFVPVELPNDYAEDCDWTDDGYADDAPRQTVRWWRERRGMSQQELSIRAGLGIGYVGLLEGNYKSAVAPKSRRALCKALRVSPSKLVLPGDDVALESIQSTEQILRAELRGARRCLRRAYDALQDAANTTHKFQDSRAYVDLLSDMEREMRGT